MNRIYKEIDINQFLTINTPEVAYFLGFIWGDGYIRKNPAYSIEIEIVAEDAKEILPIVQSLGDCGIYHRQRQGRKPSTIISFHSESLYKFLLYNDYESKSQKSACKILSLIPKNLKHYWVRGLLDADGSIFIRGQSLNPKWKACGICFYSSYDQDWTFLTSIFSGLCVQAKIKRRIRDCGNSSEFCITKRKDILTIGNYIYAGTAMGLRRKLTKFEQIIAYNSDFSKNRDSRRNS